MGDETILVASSITSLLLRKDLSLSRRVFQWIIGEDSSDVPELTIKTVSNALLLFLKENDSIGKDIGSFFQSHDMHSGQTRNITSLDCIQSCH